MIKIKNASISFKEKPALSKLSLEVKPGEILGLLGANGAGKSTTINMLLGFLKSEEGDVSINQLDCYNERAQVRRLVGYIPENVNLYPYLSGEENLDYFCKISGIEYASSELKNFLEKCGLPLKDHSKKISEYSKGMRQKVGIAIAYAKKAKVYLLDEPSSGLDPMGSNELTLLLKELAKEGASILMASHDIFRVREVCDRIGILKQGKLMKELKSKAITANQLEKLYLNFMKD